MIDIQGIEDEIRRIEKEQTTMQSCSKLAVLYSVLDHNKPDKPDKLSNYSYGSSEFLMVISQAPIDKALNILDEHMEAIKLLYPKEYSIIIRKIKELGSQ